MSAKRSLTELLTTNASAWPEVSQLVQSSPLACEIVEVDLSLREIVLVELQVTIGSMLGSMAWNCGAILVDHRWLRLLGAGTEFLPPAHIERLKNNADAPEAEGVVVGYDVLGGVFIVHGVGLNAAPGEVCYWAPDTLEWTALGFGYSGFLAFAMSDRLDVFYQDLRWEGWQDCCDQLRVDEGVAAYPMPFTQEGRLPNPVRRRAAPILEVVAAGFDFAKQLESNSQFTIEITPPRG